MQRLEFVNCVSCLIVPRHRRCASSQIPNPGESHKTRSSGCVLVCESGPHTGLIHAAFPIDLGAATDSSIVKTTASVVSAAQRSPSFHTPGATIEIGVSAKRGVATL